MLLLPCWVGATIYYVDSSCTDTNPASATVDGTGYDPSTPACTGGSDSYFVTIADVNAAAATTAPGDTISFRKGQIWREQLTVPEDGTSGNEYTFTSHGSGAKPIISGADDILGVTGDWSEQGDGVWRKNIGSTEPNQIFCDDTTRGVEDATPDTECEWTYSDPNLDVYTAAGDNNPANYFSELEASQRNYAFLASGTADYIIVDGLEMTKANLHNALGDDAHHQTWQNCIFSYAHESGWEARSGDSVDDGYMIVQDNESYWNGIDGFNLGNRMIESIIRRNTAYRNSQRGDSEHWSAGIKLTGPDLHDVLVERNKVYKNGFDGSETDVTTSASGRGIWADTVNEAAAGSFIIRHNYIYQNATMGLLIENADTVEVLYNITYGDKEYGMGGQCSDASYPFQNNAFYGNVVSNSGWQAFWFLGKNGTADSCKDNSVRNNIVYDPDWGHSLRALDGCANVGVEGSGNVYDYNAFHTEHTDFIDWDGTGYDTYDDWESAYGSTTNSVETAPLLTDPNNGDFTLQSSSPAIDAGVTLGASYDDALVPGSSWPDSVTTKDQDLLQPWEIGAYIFFGQQRGPSMGGRGIMH